MSVARVNNDENNCCNGNCFHLTLLCQTCEQQAVTSAYRLSDTVNSSRAGPKNRLWPSFRVRADRQTRLSARQDTDRCPRQGKSRVVELFIYRRIY